MPLLGVALFAAAADARDANLPATSNELDAVGHYAGELADKLGAGDDA